jgi:hypothetical protein
MKKINLAGIILLTGGIAIGIALTMISMHVVARPATTAQAASVPAKLLAEKSPPGAADAQTSQTESAAIDPKSAAPQVQSEAAAQPPADWLKPEDLTKQNAGASGTTTPPAPKYQSSHTEYYIYPTGPGGMPMSSPTGDHPITINENGQMQTMQPQWIGDNGLVQNPCVDPPSVRRRTYRH